MCLVYKPKPLEDHVESQLMNSGGDVCNDISQYFMKEEVVAQTRCVEWSCYVERLTSEGIYMPDAKDFGVQVLQ